MWSLKDSKSNGFRPSASRQTALPGFAHGLIRLAVKAGEAWKFGYSPVLSLKGSV
jgi:hypothetical protein